MGRIFLGKPLHWALVVAIFAIGWVLGAERMHVSAFNQFLILLLALSTAVVVAVLLTTRPGEQVTRDPLQEEEGE